ncbi:MAG: sterol desaturase family protein [Reyranella sp.]|uniref:sterol desaturase family protein n=1 Tax=Reyranella sp. TaxID=1929291 RepID=UPI002730D85F|nr:sterol desaturase family protein [Reyranella sp.]MDP1962525.1 sterol desaturase family protein [Reyranella sp.]MDP2374049.1 sterol desaturase family protein [Reyranella sp.]
MLAFLADAYSVAYGLVNSMLIRLAYPVGACLLYLLPELLLPRTRNSLQSYLRATTFLVVTIAINTVVLKAMEGSAGFLDVKPLAFLDLRPLTESDSWPLKITGWLVAVIGIAMVGNFFYYWMHRAQHRFGWMWRVHRVHHSITEMSATASYHHVAEDLFQFAAVTMPMAILLGVASGPVPWLVIVLANTHSYFIHSSARLNIGPLRYVLCDNRFHRIHHSREQRHIDHNFATTTPLWDVLFGTAYFPRADEWPAVGLADVAEPRTIADYLLMPFRR